MQQMDDLPLDPSPLPPAQDDEARPVWPWIVGLAIVALVTAGVVYWLRPAAAPSQKPAEAQPAPTPSEGRRTLGPAVAPVDLPALNLSDPFVRDLIGQLSSRPEVLAWLATDGLIRNMAVCIENVSEGRSPAQHLRTLAPAQRFRAAGRMERYTTDPRSFQRYDGIAGAVGALDSQGAARLYSTLKPRLDEAYQELGHAPGDIDIGVERALVHLLQTPPVRADAPLTLAVVSYRYADDGTEALSAAQKQLLRMGPRNAQTIQVKLREIARALGIPEEALPAPAPGGDR